MPTQMQPAMAVGAAEIYDAAIDRLVRYHPDVIALTGTLLEQHPDHAMGHALATYLSLMSTEAVDLPAARETAASLAAARADDHDAAHLHAIDAWLAGDWLGAQRTLDALLVQWPDDLLALLMGHQLDFFVGDAANLRDRVGRSLRAFDPSHPHYGFVRGMQAFGLEESGHYQQSEQAGLDAVERNPDDVWAIHAVVHTYEMQGRIDDGIRFLRSRDSDWGTGNLFTVHNWWHLALYLLEAGMPLEALAIYDSRVHNADSSGVALEMLDASALLWRLGLDDVDTGDRSSVLADAWLPRVEGDSWYAFNDFHAVMALAGAGRLDEATELVARLERFVGAGSATPSASNHMMANDVGLPASRSLLAFARGDHAAVVRELAPIRRHVQRFGGSHAQRDALQRTLLESAIRVGDLDLASALTSERLSLRDTSVYAGLRQARVLRALGDDASAARAEAYAASNRARFAAAAR